MKTKLTLSIDAELVDYAHRQARRKNTTISHMVSDFLRRQKARQTPLPSAREMVGSLKKYHIDDSKTAIRNAYAKKHFD